ncbi:MAG TPA: glutathione S-transferase N-terminal domain-containing protein [Candidatus Omnitrophota bacterium]|nr:glutathione S-transferase N-terminal domain-containing protein [Candidatus Omnitrophota bacterium]
MHQLTLYCFPGCSYCQKVMRQLEGKNIKITFKNIHEKTEYREELLKIGGKTQVPCLVIDGVAKYESDDIVEWLKKNC